jgi:hypothetical protein
MYLGTKMCPDTSILRQVIVVRGSRKINKNDSKTNKC